MKTIEKGDLERLLRKESERFGLLPSEEKRLTVTRSGEVLTVRFAFDGRSPYTAKKFENIIKEITGKAALKFRGIRGGFDFRENMLICTLSFVYEHVCTRCGRRITGKLRSVEILKDSVYMCSECAGKVLFEMAFRSPDDGKLVTGAQSWMEKHLQRFYEVR